MKYFKYLRNICLSLCFLLAMGTAGQTAETGKSGQNLADRIASFANKAIYNLDNDQLVAVLENFLNENPNIRALTISESIDQEVLINFHRDGQKAIYGQPIPEEILLLPKYTAISLFEGEKVGTVNVYYRAATADFLSLQELAWIEKNPSIRVHNELDWPPFNFAEFGKPKGFSIDFMNLIARKTGLKVEYINGPTWNEFLQMMKNGELEVMLNIVKTPDREKYLLFTPPYANNPNAILSLRENAFDSIQQLFGKTVAVPKGFFYEEILKRDYPQIKILAVKNILESMKAVNFGKADAAFGELAVFNHLLATHLLSDLVIAGDLDWGNPEFALLNIATRKDLPILASILSKGVNSVTPTELRSIRQNWFENLSGTRQPGLEQDGTYNQANFIIQFIGIVFAVLLVIAFAVWIARGRPKRLNIREMLFVVFFIFAGLIVSIGSLVTMLLDGQQKQTDIQTRKNAAFNLALELKQSSDDLTRFARTFAVTGEGIYEDYYQTIIGIRDGQIAHPGEYTRSYWDQVIAAVVELDSAGELYSIEKRMLELGLSETEKEKLSLAKNNSDDLVNLERVSMNAAKGRFKDTNGEFSIQGVPNLDMARGLLYGRDYHEAKAKIMKPIDDFFILLDHRTNNELTKVGGQNKAILLAITILTIFTIGLALFAFLLLKRRIIHPLSILEAGALNLKDGDYTTRVEIESKDEIGSLASSFNSMASGIDKRTKEISDKSELIRLQHNVTSKINEAQSVEHAYQICLDVVCETTNWPIGHVYIPRKNGETILVSSDIWHLQDAQEYDDFKRITEQTKFLPNEGLPGQVFASRKPDWIEDMSTQLKLSRTNKLENSSIKSAFAFPMIVGDEVEAIFEFFTSEVVEPDELLIDTLDYLGVVIGKIIERKNLEDTAREKEAQLSLALSNMSDGMFLMGKDENYILINDRYKELTRLPPELLSVGKSVRKVVEHLVSLQGFPALQSEKAVDDRMDQLAGSQSVRMEMHVPDGPVLELRNAPAGEVGTVVVATDITQRKQTEDALKLARDAAEEATKAKANFLATMSHEIRTPMNGVVGMIDLLRESSLDDDQRQMVETVQNSAYALLTIINDILDFSKIEAGKLDLEEIPISIIDVVEGVSEALAVTARKKGIAIGVFVDPNIPGGVIGDQVRLRQVLFNLAGNAVKFTENGKVLIRVEKLPSENDEATVVKFQIIDEGIGIPESAQKSLFQAFSQVDESTTRRFGGTGLGLSICQRLVELMGGEIGVDSVEGEGSNFHVTLTFPITEDHAFKSEEEDLEGLRVLVAHSDPDYRDLTPRYLQYWGARTTSIESFSDISETALSAITKEDPYDVIVLGSNYPLAEQIALIRELTENNEISSKFIATCRQRNSSERIELGNTVYVDAEPIQRGAFVRSVAVAVGRASPDIEYDEEDIIQTAMKAPTVEEAAANDQLILLAEDNLTNQNVIKRQLAFLGYAAEIANDGLEALEYYKSGKYAILLTDCHMPNMDGFELTKAIRDLETDTTNHLPVMAITASVMKEEVDNCFSAGMDDYLPKPLQMDRLRTKLRKWMPKSDAKVSPPENGANDKKEIVFEENEKAETATSPIDPQALKSVFGDDEETFVEILKEFVEPATDNVEEINKAFAERSADGVAKAAHKLKSSSRSVGANEMADLCQLLEEAGKKDDWAIIDKEAPRLPSISHDVIEYINNLN